MGMAELDLVPAQPLGTAAPYVQHPRFYFKDGSIILDVERTHFRVHQSLLNRQSEVFESMFSLKQPENAATIDGCLLVELSGDSVSDMEEFLCTLYDPFYFDQLEETSSVEALVKFVSGILRISAKYEMTHIKRKCVSVLLEKFPTTLAGCDRIMRSEYRYKTSAIVEAINLAHTAHVPEILPWAYYISTHVSVKDLLKEPNLSWRDKALCLGGKERLWHAQKTRTHAFLFEALQSEVCSVGCDGRASGMGWSDSERLRMNPHPLEEYTKWAELRLCGTCQRDLERRHREARVWLWESLPELFELGPWSSLAPTAFGLFFSSQMSDSEIQINIKGPNELKLQIAIATDKTVGELKQAVAAQSDVEAERQRLIYSGRVLKDDDQLSVYKIQSGHTVHMVKGQARQQAPAPSSSAAPQIPTMQTGQNIHDPLTQLNSHLGFGAMAGINPFADLGVNQNDPNMMTSLFNDPRVLEQMASAMSNPAVIDQVIAMNPQLAHMAPQMRQMFQSEEFRRMISNPEQLQGFMRVASLMRQVQGGSGNSPFGDPFAPPPGFPAPGVPGQNPSSTTPSTNNPPSSTTPAPPSGTTNPASARPGAGGAAPNPFNPFGLDPALMQQMLFGGGFGGGGAGGAGFEGPAGFGAPAPPADTRPPEERYQVQLQQLQDMGFTNASQNVRALMATGGNVHSAIEYILSGGGL